MSKQDITVPQNVTQQRVTFIHGPDCLAANPELGPRTSYPPGGLRLWKAEGMPSKDRVDAKYWGYNKTVANKTSWVTCTSIWRVFFIDMVDGGTWVSYLGRDFMQASDTKSEDDEDKVLNYFLGTSTIDSSPIKADVVMAFQYKKGLVQLYQWAPDANPNEMSSGMLTPQGDNLEITPPDIK